MQNELKIIEDISKDEDGNVPVQESSFHWTDIFYHQKAFEFMGIEYPNSGFLEQFQYWIWVAIFYMVVYLPCFIVVRTFLFLILPKSWLRWMFRI